MKPESGHEPHADGRLVREIPDAGAEIAYADARVDPVHATPGNTILLMAFLTAAAVFLGDALLVPITDVGSLAVGVGWLSACAAFLARSRRPGASASASDRALAWLGAAVSAAIVAMKIVPSGILSGTRRNWCHGSAASEVN
jgi:hypothetical protein